MIQVNQGVESEVVSQAYALQSKHCRINFIIQEVITVDHQPTYESQFLLESLMLHFVFQYRIIMYLKTVEHFLYPLNLFHYLMVLLMVTLTMPWLLLWMMTVSSYVCS